VTEHPQDEHQQDEHLRPDVEPEMGEPETDAADHLESDDVDREGAEPEDAEPEDVEPDDVGDPPSLPHTGDQQVDGALERLVAVQDLPPDEQVETYVGVHRALQDRLADLEG
jgi:hypothetical protein